HYRLMPGVLVIEAMAQVGGVLVYYSDTVTLGKTPLFTGIDRGKFRRQVIPGDQLIMHLEIIRRRGPVWRVRGQAFVDKALAAEAELQVFLANNPREGQNGWSSYSTPEPLGIPRQNWLMESI